MKVSRFETLDAARRDYLARVDRDAEAIQARHVTPGQAMVYEYKRQDAEQFTARGRPDDPGAHPWVAAEAGATGATLAQAAAWILARRDMFLSGAVELERARRGAKHIIGAAQSVRAMHEAHRTAVTAMEAVSDQIASQQRHPQ